MVSKSIKSLEEKLKDNQFAILMFLIAAAFFFVLLGLAGLRTFLGFVFLFFLPTYLIFRNFDIESEEKIAFSFLVGLGLFPTFVYYLGLLISSMRWSIAISFVLLMAIGIAFTKYYPKLKKDKESKEEKD